eukprot:6667292-Pyramimonas_sp.AAC.1
MRPVQRDCGSTATSYGGRASRATARSPPWSAQRAGGTAASPGARVAAWPCRVGPARRLGSPSP